MVRSNLRIQTRAILEKKNQGGTAETEIPAHPQDLKVAAAALPILSK
jgi:hypothetical protein